MWGDEFRGIHALGGLTMLILHPQYTGRPSRLNMLQQLVDEMRDTGDVWFVNGIELARYAPRTSAPTGGRAPSHSGADSAVNG